MQVLINKRFLRDLARIPKQDRIRIEDFVFSKIRDYQNITEIPNLSKLKGYHNYYRIRFGEYRAGIIYENNNLIFKRLLHRKDIYKFFP